VLGDILAKRAVTQESGRFVLEKRKRLRREIKKASEERSEA